MPKSLWLFVVAAVAFLGAFMALRTPEPVPANAPVSVFSAQRAMADAKEIAKAPHPTGSTEIVRVRGYVVDRLRQIGLATDLRPGQGVSANPFGRADVSAAAVQNIVGVIPGKAPGKPALLVMSHYDTVRNSPGAADDTAGVASALEIARMIHAGPQPERDVIFLFTDAEEAGLLGAQAFFASDPLAAHVGAVINMEARGDDGLAAMFETGPANAGLIAMMAQKGLKPNANSMAAAVYHKMPNGTDFTEAMRKDLPGLNFAFEDDQLAYHSPLATPGHLDPGALQHLGETAGAMATALASAPEIPKASGNAVYGDYLGQFLIHYPPSVGWVLLAVAGLLTGVSLIRAIMAEKLRLLEVARGIGVSVMIVLFTGLVYDVISRLFHLPDYIPVYAALVHGEAFVGALLLGGLALSVAIAGAGSAAKGRVTVTLTCALAALIASLAYRHPDMFAIVSGVVTALLGFACLGKRIGVWGQWGGALLLALALGVTLQVVEPGVTPLIVWPLLLGSLMAIAVSLPGQG